MKCATQGPMIRITGAGYQSKSISANLAYVGSSGNDGGVASEKQQFVLYVLPLSVEVLQMSN
jgi:hypothetical protein